MWLQRNMCYAVCLEVDGDHTRRLNMHYAGYCWSKRKKKRELFSLLDTRQTSYMKGVAPNEKRTENDWPLASFCSWVCFCGSPLLAHCHHTHNLVFRVVVDNIFEDEKICPAPNLRNKTLTGSICAKSRMQTTIQGSDNHRTGSLTIACFSFG